MVTQPHFHALADSITNDVIMPVVAAMCEHLSTLAPAIAILLRLWTANVW